MQESELLRDDQVVKETKFEDCYHSYQSTMKNTVNQLAELCTEAYDDLDTTNQNASFAKASGVLSDSKTSQPKPKSTRSPNVYNLFVATLPKTQNKFSYAAKKWKEVTEEEKQAMRAFLTKHMEELKEIHPHIQTRFEAVAKLWLLSKN